MLEKGWNKLRSSPRPTWDTIKSGDIIYDMNLVHYLVLETITPLWNLEMLRLKTFDLEKLTIRTITIPQKTRSMTLLWKLVSKFDDT